MLVVKFDWTPKGAPISYTEGGNTYPYTRQADNVARTSDSRYFAYRAVVNTQLTFTATTTVIGSGDPVRYRWDMGDGTVKYGPTVAHTYKIAPTASTGVSQVVVRLTVTDAFNRTYSAVQLLNLRTS